MARRKTTRKTTQKTTRKTMRKTRRTRSNGWNVTVPDMKW